MTIYTYPSTYYNKYEALSIIDNLTNKTETSKIIKEKIEIYENIDELLKLEDNWDGYDALKIEYVIIENTKDIINLLPDFIIYNMLEYDIYPNTNGTITIEIKSFNNDLLTLEIGEKEISGFLTNEKSETFLIQKLIKDSDNFCDELLETLSHYSS